MHDDMPPHSLPHPPQFVAVKSLILKSSKKHLQYNCMSDSLTLLQVWIKYLYRPDGAL
jgi:hypothetical protein